MPFNIYIYIFLLYQKLVSLVRSKDHDMKPKLLGP